jgi:hypothetical protein
VARPRARDEVTAEANAACMHDVMGSKAAVIHQSAVLVVVFFSPAYIGAAVLGLFGSTFF